MASFVRSPINDKLLELAKEMTTIQSMTIDDYKRMLDVMFTIIDEREKEIEYWKTQYREVDQKYTETLYNDPEVGYGRRR